MKEAIHFVLGTSLPVNGDVYRTFDAKIKKAMLVDSDTPYKQLEFLKLLPKLDEHNWDQYNKTLTEMAKQFEHDLFTQIKIKKAALDKASNSLQSFLLVDLAILYKKYALTN